MPGGNKKGLSTQHCLLLMIEKWKEAVDKDRSWGELLTDLSKVLNCLSHDLLIAKLHFYGISVASLKLLTDNLTNRKQETKVETSYSFWGDIKPGVPQRSIFGPPLCNIFVFVICF